MTRADILTDRCDIPGSDRTVFKTPIAALRTSKLIYKTVMNCL